MKCPKCNLENPDTSRFCADCGTQLLAHQEGQESSDSPTKTIFSPPEDLKTGKIFAGKYRIIGELGRGGMGIVYKAEDIRLKRTVALKFLPQELTQDLEARERFTQEAQAASALEHPNICTIYEIDETEDGRVYIAMACYEGESLKEKIKQGPLKVEDAISITMEISQGLAKAHQKGIIHRDIKPANIMMTPDGASKIVDFGLAKLAGQARRTRSGATLGTVAYMSPEQVKGASVDHRSDIWSLGVVLYEMLSGQLPFKGEYEQAVIYSILDKEPDPISHLCSGVPKELDNVIQRSLQKEREKRFPQAQDFMDSLAAIKRKLESALTESRQIEARRRRKKYFYAACSVLAVALMAIGAYLFLSAKSRRLGAVSSELQPLVKAGRLDEVFTLLDTSGFEPQDFKNQKLVNQAFSKLTLQSSPAKATVRLARVRSTPPLAMEKLLDIGNTPLEDYVMVAGEYLVILEFAGAEPVQFIINPEPGKTLSLERSLLRADEKLPGMIKIEEGRSQTGQILPGFFMDKYEVTNADFIKFISAGGYKEKELWLEDIILNGQPATWESAIKNFVDRTGIPGPRFWSGGKYPDGKENHPVIGVSWYEAMAYARWAEKELPTWDPWWRAALGSAERVFPWGNDVKASHLRANFGFRGTQPVGTYLLGVSPFGCFDMAGNVREWLRDLAPSGTAPVVGGSWKDPPYMFEPSHAEYFERAFADENIGFRCMKAIMKNPKL